jgi:hypothetical protein
MFVPATRGETSTIAIWKIRPSIRRGTLYPNTDIAPPEEPVGEGGMGRGARQECPGRRSSRVVSDSRCFSGGKGPSGRRGRPAPRDEAPGRGGASGKGRRLAASWFGVDDSPLARPPAGGLSPGLRPCSWSLVPRGGATLAAWPRLDPWKIPPTSGTNPLDFRPGHAGPRKNTGNLGPASLGHGALPAHLRVAGHKSQRARRLGEEGSGSGACSEAGFSAWSTGSACGRRAGRASCAPSCGRRG